MKSMVSQVIAVAAIFGWLAATVHTQDNPGDSAPTPRAADGHPDLSGLWNGPAPGAPGARGPVDRAAYGAVGIDPNIGIARQTADAKGVAGYINFERDNTLMTRMGSNKPMYKPEYWERVKNLDQNGNTADPSYGCLPAGVPREGPPTEIIQTPRQIVFLYPGGGGQIAVPASYRAIPMDGRKHTNLEDLDGSWYGESIGSWDGDTLVVDTIGFNTSTWLDIEGYFHSENMHVIERLTRHGNTLTWGATVDDPDVLMQPWVVTPRTVFLNPNAGAMIPEALPCTDRDLAHTVTKEHH